LGYYSEMVLPQGQLYLTNKKRDISGVCELFREINLYQ